MREWMMEQGMIFYFFCAVGVMGAAAAALANRTYKRLIKEADGMENSQHRLIKYIKLKYSSYYTLGMKANDEQAMVRRCCDCCKLWKYSLWFECRNRIQGDAFDDSFWTYGCLDTCNSV